jgi:clan AA aspartic protease (TIGR02281 family)
MRPVIRPIALAARLLLLSISPAVAGPLTTCIGIIEAPVAAVGTLPRPVATQRVVKLDAVPLLSYRKGNGVQLQVTVGGEQLLMLLDTGATMAQIPTGMANRLVALGRARFNPTPVTVRLANGAFHTARSVTVDTVVLGDHVLHNVVALVSDSGDPLLGFPVVDGIAPFTIDTRAMQLVFHPS